MPPFRFKAASTNRQPSTVSRQRLLHERKSYAYRKTLYYLRSGWDAHRFGGDLERYGPGAHPHPWRRGYGGGRGGHPPGPAVKDAGNPYEAYCAWIAAEYGSEASGAELLQRRDAIAREKLAHEIDYKPGAEQFLAFLKSHGFTLGIATTTRRKNIDIYQHENENIRRKAPFASYFSFIYTREDVSAIKPDPEIYGKIQREWNFSPAECLIFEDSLTGVLAARNAGIEAVSMYDRYSEAEQKEIQRLSTYHFQNYGEALEMGNAELRMKT